MTRRFFMAFLIACVAVLSGRSLLICTMNMAAPVAKSHCAGAPAPADTDCMIEVNAPSGLPSVEQSPTVDLVAAIAYQLAPVLSLATQSFAAFRLEPIAFESPPASIQILRI